MPAKPGQKMIGTYVDPALAERFRSWARRSDGGVAGALRRLMVGAMDGSFAIEGLHGASPISSLAPAGSGRGSQVGVRFKDTWSALGKLVQF